MLKFQNSFRQKPECRNEEIIEKRGNREATAAVIKKKKKKITPHRKKKKNLSTNRI